MRLGAEALTRAEYLALSAESVAELLHDEFDCDLRVVADDDDEQDDWVAAGLNVA